MKRTVAPLTKRYIIVSTVHPKSVFVLVSVNTRESVQEARDGMLGRSSRGARVLGTTDDIVARDIALRSIRISPI